MASQNSSSESYNKGYALPYENKIKSKGYNNLENN